MEIPTARKSLRNLIKQDFALVLNMLLIISIGRVECESKTISICYIYSPKSVTADKAPARLPSVSPRLSTRAICPCSQLINNIRFSANCPHSQRSPATPTGSAGVALQRRSFPHQTLYSSIAGNPISISNNYYYYYYYYSQPLRSVYLVYAGW